MTDTVCYLAPADISNHFHICDTASWHYILSPLYMINADCMLCLGKACTFVLSMSGKIDSVQWHVRMHACAHTGTVYAHILNTYKVHQTVHVTWIGSVTHCFTSSHTGLYKSHVFLKLWVAAINHWQLINLLGI